MAGSWDGERAGETDGPMAARKGARKVVSTAAWLAAARAGRMAATLGEQTAGRREEMKV